MISALSRFQGCLVGVAIGDAMGMPWEHMTHAQILERTNGCGITDFCDSDARGPGSMQNLQLGDTTDDWQLTAAVARSIIFCKGFDVLNCAMEHAREFHRTTTGWGGTTRKGIARFIEETSKNKDLITELLDSPSYFSHSGKGCGNGVAMKVSPIGLWNHFAHSQKIDPSVILRLRNDCKALGKLTHSDERAWLSAFAIAYGISYIMNFENYVYPAIDNKCSADKFASIIIAVVNNEEIRYSMPREHTLTHRLSNLRMDVKSMTITHVSQWFGTSCFALESIPFSLAMFLRHPTDFRAALLETINEGGDADSNAAIVGALVGANCGIDAIPIEWRLRVPKVAEALDLANKLYEARGQVF